MRKVLFICLVAFATILPSCDTNTEIIALEEQHRKDSVRIDSFASMAVADKIHLQELTDSIAVLNSKKRSSAGKTTAHTTVNDISEDQLAKEVATAIDLIKQKVIPVENDKVPYTSWDFGTFSLTQYPDSTATLQILSADGAYIVDDNANGLNVSEEDSYGKTRYTERDALSQASARVNYFAAIRSLKTELQK